MSSKLDITQLQLQVLQQIQQLYTISFLEFTGITTEDCCPLLQTEHDISELPKEYRNLIYNAQRSFQFCLTLADAEILFSADDFRQVLGFCFTPNRTSEILEYLPSSTKFRNWIREYFHFCRTHQSSIQTLQVYSQLYYRAREYWNFTFESEHFFYVLLTAGLMYQRKIPICPDPEQIQQLRDTSHQQTFQTIFLRSWEESQEIVKIATELIERQEKLFRSERAKNFETNFEFQVETFVKLQELIYI